MERPNAWKGYTNAQLDELEAFAQDYIAFISQNKTERECVRTAVELAEAAGYRNLDELVASGEQLVAGARVYAVLRGKTMILVELGSRPLTEGFNILGAHVDSPRLDVKQNPLEEKNDLAFLDTHYYGGVKKYQWVTMPLALHGVVAKRDGSVVPVCIGEDASDPVFVISDLLIHLAQEQLQKKATEVIDGEMLDVLVGGRPLVVKDGDKDEAKDPVKAMLLEVVKEHYDIEEEATLHLVLRSQGMHIFAKLLSGKIVTDRKSVV